MQPPPYIMGECLPIVRGLTTTVPLPAAPVLVVAVAATGAHPVHDRVVTTAQPTGHGHIGSTATVYGDGVHVNGEGYLRDENVRPGSRVYATPGSCSSAP